ncbi:thioester domain-containing protein [Streptomyces piniterrae]|uniref:thioester domain-containing protein n=1 Tax=Streptomyces piniterrae TaxID=2571125 RepID=UPI00145D105E|nr:thioester domain-containing protein [Streptomyces piniterrae]
MFAAALLATSGVTSSGIAAAEPTKTAAGDSATVATLGRFLHSDTIDVPGADGGPREGGTMTLRLRGEPLEVYCVDFHHPTHTGVRYSETDWKKTTLSGNRDAGKIAWILNHSYPGTTIHRIASTTGIRGLTADAAAAATQAAIWHFSDKVDARPRNPSAARLTDWLESHATKLAEPRPSLRLSPSHSAGKPGEKIGPITLTTSAAEVRLRTSAPSGVQVVDEHGAPVSTASDGDKLFISANSTNSVNSENSANSANSENSTAVRNAKLAATATVKVPVGRAFTAQDAATQTMILAGSAPVSLAAEATVEWIPPREALSSPAARHHSPAAAPHLAQTGSSATPLFAITASLFVAMGGAMVFFCCRGRLPFRRCARRR